MRSPGLAAAGVSHLQPCSWFRWSGSLVAAGRSAKLPWTNVLVKVFFFISCLPAINFQEVNLSHCHHFHGAWLPSHLGTPLLLTYSAGPHTLAQTGLLVRL